MARGSEGQENLDLFFMTIRGLKAGESVHMTQSRPTGEKGKYEELENINSISGDLVKVETRTRQFEGKAKEEIKLWLKDQLAGEKGEMYVVSCGMNSIGRNIVNNLASVEGHIGNLRINVYTNKTSGMPALYMEHNGQKLSWKYQWEELSKYVTKTTKKAKNEKGVVVEVTENDMFELDEFLLNIFKNEIAKKVDPSKQLKEKQPSPAPVAVAEGVDDAGDDLPF